MDTFTTWRLTQAGISILVFVLLAIVHVAFALAVLRDAEFIARRGEGLFLVGAGMWAFAALLGGVTIVVAYWAIHYSTLRPRKQNQVASFQQSDREATSEPAQSAGSNVSRT